MDDSNSQTFANGYFSHSQSIKITRILRVNASVNFEPCLLLETPTVRLWRGNFWCFGLAVAYGRWLLTRGDRTWRFDCITFRFQAAQTVRTFTFYGFVHLRHLLALSARYWRRKKRQQWSWKLKASSRPARFEIPALRLTTAISTKFWLPKPQTANCLKPSLRSVLRTYF